MQLISDPVESTILYKEHTFQPSNTGMSQTATPLVFVFYMTSLTLRNLKGTLARNILAFFIIFNVKSVLF
jgi:hypothetical protein